MTDTQAAKDKLVQDFNEVVSDTEQLLKTVATAGNEKTQALRANVEQSLRQARERMREFEQTARERTRAVARQTDEYVQAHPWESVAAAAGIGALIGIVVGLLLNRR